MVDKIKKINPKKIIKIFTLLWGVALIVVMTLTNLGVNEAFDWNQWLSNSLILFAILIFGLLIGESVGRDKQKEKDGGLFQRALKEYHDFYKSIKDELIYFFQWHIWFLPQELERKKISYLVSKGVNYNKAVNIVKYLSKEDVENLKEHPIELKEEKIIIRKLTNEEYEIVKSLYENKIKIDNANASYYLTDFADSKANQSILEEGNTIEKERKKNRHINRFIKIATSGLFSILFGLFTVKEMMGNDQMQAWYNLIQRMTALFTSVLSGWVSSSIDVKLEARKIDNKTKVLQIFHDNLAKEVFIPVKEQQLAEKEYKEYLEDTKGEEENGIQD